MDKEMTKEELWKEYQKFVSQKRRNWLAFVKGILWGTVSGPDYSLKSFGEWIIKNFKD